MELSLHLEHTFLRSMDMVMFLTTISIVCVIGFSSDHAILLNIREDSIDSSGVYAIYQTSMIQNVLGDASFTT